MMPSFQRFLLNENRLKKYFNTCHLDSPIQWEFKLFKEIQVCMKVGK